MIFLCLHHTWPWPLVGHTVAECWERGVALPQVTLYQGSLWRLHSGVGWGSRHPRSAEAQGSALGFTFVAVAVLTGRAGSSSTERAST